MRLVGSVANTCIPRGSVGIDDVEGVAIGAVVAASVLPSALAAA